ncbi:hypothetical protein B9Z19DRAFT_1123616 [Tuber borchii]|uniref:Uncharacterized protein n=1 Tax=Tuber borchii TaxID=42251 RepID=A0A2T6ZY74_TUBBO|nr:hypothetical protein B9Z19DRAFT_1123616 [Tuber borchii]
MQRFLEPPTRFTAALRKGRFLHITQGSSRAPTSTIIDSAAFREFEGRWLDLCPSLRNALLRVLNERDPKSFKFFEEEQARMSDHLESQARPTLNRQNVFLKHLEARDKRHDEKVKELILHNCDLRDAALEERTKRLKVEGRYNVRGALARMVYEAKLQKKIPPTLGIQQGLDKLAHGREFSAALGKEVQARKLDLQDVMASVNRLYEIVSKCTSGNDDTFNDIIIVRASKFSDNERAALAVFFKIQSRLNAFKWREDTSLKGDE